MDETKLTADLPNLSVEIIHRAAENGRAEQVTIQLNATPDFRAALPLLAGMAQLPLLLGGGSFTHRPDQDAHGPFALWSQWTTQMMAPWLSLARANPVFAAMSDYFLTSTKK